ncbi:MAG: hypothetical protein WEB78_12125 [Ilumatobacteraceae bacterium]
MADANKHDAALMRWVCLHQCPALTGCRRDVANDTAAGRIVVGLRAGQSQRQRNLKSPAGQPAN